MEIHDILFFKSSADLSKWFRKYGTIKTELWIGFYKKGVDKKSVTYKEAVDEALCYGWIDGIRKSVDDVSYTNRFTPRKKTSNWSLINIKRIEELTSEGRMQPEGLHAFETRDLKRTGVYSFEQEAHRLSPGFEARFKNNKKAWKYFNGKAPYYQRTSIHWVMSAKQEATRLKRLDQLILDSAAQRSIPLLNRDPRK